MSRRPLVALLLASSAGLCGWAVAQSRGPSSPPASGDPAPARYAVSPGDGPSVLVDVGRGRTWYLDRSADGRSFVWLPVHRIDDPDEAAHWKAEQSAVRDKLEAVRREEARARRDGR